MKSKLFLLISIFAIALFFTACDKTTEEVEDLTTPEDLTALQNLTEDTEEEIDYNISFRDGDCPTVTVEPDDGSFPKTITIDYGDEGCEGPHGRFRKGQIVVTVSDTMINEGAVRTVTFVNFYVDEALIEGTRTVTNTGLNEEGQPTFTRTVTGAKITFGDGTFTEWETSHLVTTVAGYDTPQRFDDEFEITGSASGVNRHGDEFTSEITTPLLKRRNCRWIVSGVRVVTVGDKTFTIDYGDGNCDRFATVTLPNGNTKVVRIRPWWRH